jgi:hypothetical protein
MARRFSLGLEVLIDGESGRCQFFEVEVLLHLDCCKPGVKARGVLPAHPRSQETARGSTVEPASEIRGLERDCPS